MKNNIMRKISKKTYIIVSVFFLFWAILVNAYYFTPKINNDTSFEYFHQMNLNIKDEATRAFLGLPPYVYKINNIKNLIK